MGRPILSPLFFTFLLHLTACLAAQCACPRLQPQPSFNYTAAAGLWKGAAANEGSAAAAAAWEVTAGRVSAATARARGSFVAAAGCRGAAAPAPAAAGCRATATATPEAATGVLPPAGKAAVLRAATTNAHTVPAAPASGGRRGGGEGAAAGGNSTAAGEWKRKGVGAAAAVAFRGNEKAVLVSDIGGETIGRQAAARCTGEAAAAVTVPATATAACARPAAAKHAAAFQDIRTAGSAKTATNAHAQGSTPAVAAATAVGTATAVRDAPAATVRAARNAKEKFHRKAGFLAVSPRTVSPCLGGKGFSSGAPAVPLAAGVSGAAESAATPAALSCCRIFAAPYRWAASAAPVFAAAAAARRRCCHVALCPFAAAGRVRTSAGGVRIPAAAAAIRANVASRSSVGSRAALLPEWGECDVPASGGAAGPFSFEEATGAACRPAAATTAAAAVQQRRRTRGTGKSDDGRTAAPANVREEEDLKLLQQAREKERERQRRVARARAALVLQQRKQRHQIQVQRAMRRKEFLQKRVERLERVFLEDYVVQQQGARSKIGRKGRESSLPPAPTPTAAAGPATTTAAAEESAVAAEIRRYGEAKVRKLKQLEELVESSVMVVQFSATGIDPRQQWQIVRKLALAGFYKGYKLVLAPNALFRVALQRVIQRRSSSSSSSGNSSSSGRSSSSASSRSSGSSTAAGSGNRSEASTYGQRDVGRSSSGSGRVDGSSSGKQERSSTGVGGGSRGDRSSSSESRHNNRENQGRSTSRSGTSGDDSSSSADSRIAEESSSSGRWVPVVEAIYRGKDFFITHEEELRVKARQHGIDLWGKKSSSRAEDPAAAAAAEEEAAEAAAVEAKVQAQLLRKLRSAVWRDDPRYQHLRIGAGPGGVWTQWEEEEEEGKEEEETVSTRAAAAAAGGTEGGSRSARAEEEAKKKNHKEEKERKEEEVPADVSAVEFPYLEVESWEDLFGSEIEAMRAAQRAAREREAAALATFPAAEGEVTAVGSNAEALLQHAHGSNYYFFVRALPGTERLLPAVARQLLVVLEEIAADVRIKAERKGPPLRKYKSQWYDEELLPHVDPKVAAALGFWPPPFRQQQQHGQGKEQQQNQTEAALCGGEVKMAMIGRSILTPEELRLFARSKTAANRKILMQKAAHWLRRVAQRLVGALRSPAACLAAALQQVQMKRLQEQARQDQQQQT